MKSKVIYIITSLSIIFASGGYDHGTSAGKGIIDISITLNPFNYFKQGQTYAIIGYGLTDRIDIHGYYSYIHSGADNYYGGVFYQFFDGKYLDLSTAIGVRFITGIADKHIFSPQLLYTIHLNKKNLIGGSFVSIKDNNKYLGTTIDIFVSRKFYESEKLEIDFSLGAFNPIAWEPKGGKWHPTYSIDIKIK